MNARATVARDRRGKWPESECIERIEDCFAHRTWNESQRAKVCDDDLAVGRHLPARVVHRALRVFKGGERIEEDDAFGSMPREERAEVDILGETIAYLGEGTRVAHGVSRRQLKPSVLRPRSLSVKRCEE